MTHATTFQTRRRRILGGQPERYEKFAGDLAKKWSKSDVMAGEQRPGAAWRCNRPGEPAFTLHPVAKRPRRGGNVRTRMACRR